MSRCPAGEQDQDDTTAASPAARPDAQSGENLLPAALESVRQCPARAQYIELWFTTAEGQWNWCFPPPAQQHGPLTAPIALTIGRYGVQACPVTSNGLGEALDGTVALRMILAGAEVVIARSLLSPRG